MDDRGWYAWVQPCIEASLLDSGEKQMQEVKETEKQQLWIMKQYWRMEIYIMCWVEGAGNEKYVAHNPSNPGAYIRCIQCGTGMVRVGNREEV